MSSMVQSSSQDLESGNVGDTSGYPHPPRPTRDPSFQGGNDYRDSSWPLHAMYSKIAQEEDNNDAENHRQNADGILVFTGLFSATVAALLAVTLPDLKPSSEDTSAFYLASIYQLLANSNASVGLVPSALVKPPPFSPPGYIVWVNTLWLLALVISLSGATMATLEREFVSRHISVTQSKEHLPETRARIRALLIKRPYGFLKLRRSFELLSMLHIALFFFLAGLLIYIYNTSATPSLVPFAGILSFTAQYILLTVLPMLNPTELFYTPLSPIIFSVRQLILTAYNVFYSGSMGSDYLGPYDSGRYLEDRIKSTEKAALKPSQEIDTEVLERMLLVLDNDHALEGFFDAIPGFCDSSMVHKPLDLRITTRLQQTLDAFLDRTFSSHLVPELARNDRLITCLNAAYSALGRAGVSQVLGNFFNGHRDEALESVEIGHSLVRWGHSSENLISPNIRRIVACIVARAQDRDDRWAKLVEKVFDIPYGDIRGYAAHGDSVLLAILNRVTRKALRTDRSEQGVLESLSQFDIHDTATELRHEFCTLWNEIVEKARNEANEEETRITAAQILTEIHHLFADLHQGTDSAPIRFPGPGPISGDDNVPSWPWSYRSCSVPVHRPDSAVDNPATTSPTAPPPIQLSDSPNASPHLTLPSQLPLTTSRGLAIEEVTAGNADMSVTSGIADPVHGSDFGGSSALQQAEEAETIPPPFVSGSLPTPITTPALRSANSVVPSPSIDSTPMQTDDVHHPVGTPPSALSTIPLSVAPQVVTVPDQYLDPNDGANDAQYDNQDIQLSTLREDHLQSPPGGSIGL